MSSLIESSATAMPNSPIARKHNKVLTVTRLRCFPGAHTSKGSMSIRAATMVASLFKSAAKDCKTYFSSIRS
jgi:hypothetical protein